MARLLFAANISLDGFVNDARGDFDFAEPSDEVHRFWNDLDRSAATHVYGRRLYETMVFWETMPPDESAVMNEYAEVWRDSDKIVVSTTLADVSSARTTLWRDLDGLAALKASSPRDITIGGPTLAARAMDLIDEVQLIVYPVLVGGGTRFFGEGIAGRLELTESRVFGGGVIGLRYRVLPPATS